MPQSSSSQAEVQASQSELQSLRALVEAQAKELERAWGRVHELRVRLRAPEPILHGRKIAIIGPSFREATYRKLVEQLGARFLFSPSNEKLSQIDRVSSKADGVVFLTGYTSHAASQRVRTATARHGIPLVLVHATGLDQLEDALVNQLASQLGSVA